MLRLGAGTHVLLTLLAHHNGTRVYFKLNSLSQALSFLSSLLIDLNRELTGT
eukprot:SAG31_NODE_4165_length_3518_cov_5.005850_1_plen_52_part_00